MATMREASKQNWTSANTKADIDSGSLQRIAGATEKMALNHQTLINERDRYKDWWEQGKSNQKVLKNENNALRSVISRLKNERAQAAAATLDMPAAQEAGGTHKA